jgi:hypothetical protein
MYFTLVQMVQASLMNAPLHFLGPDFSIDQSHVYSIDIFQMVAFVIHSTQLDQVT